jgi:hypothetical protein
MEHKTTKSAGRSSFFGRLPATRYPALVVIVLAALGAASWYVAEFMAHALRTADSSMLAAGIVIGFTLLGALPILLSKDIS